MRRKTATEKRIIGTYKPSRDRKKLSFSKTEAEIKPPAYLRKNKLAYAEWKAVAPFLEAEGILKQPDVSLLASYCILYSRWREATLEVETKGQIITVTSQTRTGKTQKAHRESRRKKRDFVSREHDACCCEVRAQSFR
jgi:P27 family predicted phage terminase small subunit